MPSVPEAPRPRSAAARPTVPPDRASGAVHHFYYARVRAALFLLVLAPFGGYQLAALYGLSVFLSWPALRWLYVPAVPLYLWGLWRLVRKLWWRQPVLTLDSEGILDHRGQGRRIPWRSIRKLYIGPHGSSTSLLIAFQSREAMVRVLGGAPPLGRRLTQLENSIIAPGAAWGIPLGPLRCRTGQVLALAEQLHAQALGREAPAAR
jgi:hypothetical protein